MGRRNSLKESLCKSDVMKTCVHVCEEKCPLQLRWLCISICGYTMPYQAVCRVALFPHTDSEMPGQQCQRTGMFALVWMENCLGVVLQFTCHGKASPQWQSFLLASLLQCVCLSASGPLFSPNFTCLVSWVGWSPIGS